MITTSRHEAEQLTATDAEALHEAANHAAELGYKVIRLRPGDKLPVDNDWPNVATDDLEAITGWYQDGTPWNYGIVTAGLCVVDIDVKEDYPTNEWYKSNAERLMDSPAIQTPRGGAHFYFRQPEGVTLRNTTGTHDKGIANHVDTRANGGYVVGPGSVVNGRSYQALPDRQLELLDSLPFLPDFVLNALKRKDRERAYNAPATTDIVSEGSRNSTLTSLAGKLRRSGFGYDAIYGALQAENDRLCKPPLDNDEVSRIADSVARYPSDAVQQEPVRKIIRSFGELSRDFRGLREPIVDGLIRKGETANLISDAKSGKSWMTYGLAYAVANGFPWFDFETTQQRVLLVDNELHVETLTDRLMKVCEALGHPEQDMHDKIDTITLRGDLMGLDEIGQQLEWESVPGRYGLIVFDAKYRFESEESKDENGNGDQTRFYNTIDRIALRTNSAIALVHHTSKGSQADKKVTDIGAGGGAQSRAPDCHLVIRQHEEVGACVLDAVTRSFAPIKPMGIRFDWPLWSLDESLDVNLLDGLKSKSQEKQNKDDILKKARITQELEKPGAPEWVTNKMLQPMTGISRSVLGRLIPDLQYEGKLESREVRKGGKTTDEYRLIDTKKVSG